MSKPWMFKPLEKDASKEEIIERLNEITDLIDEFRCSEIKRLQQESERLRQQVFAQSEIDKLIKGVTNKAWNIPNI